MENPKTAGKLSLEDEMKIADMMDYPRSPEGSGENDIDALQSCGDEALQCPFKYLGHQIRKLFEGSSHG